MSQILLNHIQGLLNNLGRDIQNMADSQSDSQQKLFDALDDISAHLLASQAILCALMAKTPVDHAEVKNWIIERTKQFNEGGSEKALALADFLLTGKIPE
ncbi:MAG: hypothetical protein HZA67_12240 [Rhodospirillales bacterium]|jgi:hypothetical protein|nr:hypothetical protein [Rhodospirillales bacterium]